MKDKIYKKPEISKKQLEQELVEATEALWQANQKLKKEEKMRTEMIANLSHDLRGSLTALTSAVDLLKTEEEMDPVRYRELIMLMDRRLKNQKAMLDDLFFLAKLETGQRSLKKEPVECGVFLEEYFYCCCMDLKYEKRRLLLEVPEKFNYFIEIDIQTIIRVLDNLFINALRYSKDQAQITLGAKKQEEEIWIYVRDTGNGISQEDLPYIFERTFRGSRCRSPEDGGSGLGLAIVREIITQHQGRIWCESRLGEGSNFTFALPLYLP